MKQRYSILFLLIYARAVVACSPIDTHFFRRALDDLVYDNENHYLPCDRLPTETEVLYVVREHRTVVEAIEKVNPGLVGVEIDTTSCQGRADILFWYVSHQDRLEIKELIGSETFFGVPYRLENR